MADETDVAEQPAATDDAASQPAALPGNLTAPGSNADGSQDGEPEDWKPPQTDEAGFAIDGHGLPINLLRRSKTLADQGATEDPAGAVAPEGIASAGEMLAAYDEAHPPLSGMTKAKLVAQAEAEGVELPENALVDDISAAIEAARPARI